MDFFNIGSSPPEEGCAQVGDVDYSEKSRQECQRYIQVLRAKLGPEPETAQLRVKSFPHDFGTYREVVCYWQDQAGMDYALLCEGAGPLNWDDVRPLTAAEKEEFLTGSKQPH